MIDYRTRNSPRHDDKRMNPQYHHSKPPDMTVFIPHYKTDYLLSQTSSGRPLKSTSRAIPGSNPPAGDCLERRTQSTLDCTATNVELATPERSLDEQVGVMDEICNVFTIIAGVCCYGPRSPADRSLEASHPLRWNRNPKNELTRG